MTSASTNSTKKGKLLDLPLLTLIKKRGVGIDFILGGVPGKKGGTPIYWGGGGVFKPRVKL